jgi:C-5 cytosine-specific DNA methylase
VRPRLFDLFSGAGGAAMGYHRAGFEVVGVDIRPQPNYPFTFIEDDALSLLRTFTPSVRGWWDEPGFDAIHASPPCEHYAAVTAWRGDQDEHEDLVGPTRKLLQLTGLPWVIENVPEAELRDPFLLCGSMVGLRVKRHRHFETNWMPARMAPFSCNHVGLLPFMHKGERAYADAMGCEWMSNREARKAIPPAYTELIGHQLLQHLRVAA